MKKIKNLAIIVLMTTFLIISGTNAYATTGSIKEDSSKLRKAPDSKTVLDLLDEGDKVEILEQEEGWYKVKATTEIGKVTGYVSEDLIDVEEDNTNVESQIQKPVQEPEETPVEVFTEIPENNEIVSTDIITENIEENKQYTLEQETSIKALPLMNSIEKAKISGNIKVIEIINDWSRIENDTESGWIRTNLLKQLISQAENPVQEQPAETIPEEKVTTETTEPELTTTTTTTEPEETTTEMSKTGYVSAEGLRVRKEPSTDSEELDSLSKNDKVKIIGQTGNWYKIDLNGEIGYVSSKYISDTRLPETTSRSGSLLKNETEENKKTTTEESEETTAQKSPEPETSGASGDSVVEYAKKYLGYKYVSGGASPESGFDCSGFTSYVYKNFGISLNRASKDQIKNGVSVEKSELQLGDIVLFNNDANTAIGHVGIYVGDGNFIHASNPSDGVKITTLTTGYYQKRYVGARRVI